jgi:TRAP-type C4-dicarboxylate transport system permease small subunit
MNQFIQKFGKLYTRCLTIVVKVLAVIAGASVLTMILIPCTDIVLRLFGKALPGAYDLVRMAGLLAISFGLPYTTAVKGHVAIEVLYLRLSGIGRIILDTVIQLTCIGLFALLTWESLKYGIALKQSGVVLPTSQIPLFWMAYVISLNSLVMILVFINNLLHPGKEMIKP